MNSCRKDGLLSVVINMNVISVSVGNDTCVCVFKRERERETLDCSLEGSFHYLGNIVVKTNKHMLTM